MKEEHPRPSGNLPADAAALDLPDLIRVAMQRDPAATAIEFAGRNYPWQFALDIARGLEEALDKLGIAPGERVGLISHNRPAHLATLWGLLMARRCVTMIYGYQSPEKLAADIAALRCPLIVADRRDWTEPAIAAARAAGTAALSIGDHGIEWVTGLDRVGTGARRDLAPGIAVEILSSGTTGTPKRIGLTMTSLEATTRANMASLTQLAGTQGGSAPLIMLLPLGNISGVYSATPSAVLGHPVTVLEKFDIEHWLELVRRYRPAMVDLVPSALTMLLMRGVTREDLAGIKVIRSGTTALDPEVHRIFAEDFGIPINLMYGASEFCGTITLWTMDELERYEAIKRGSCGRALPGVALRVVDAESGEVLGVDRVGLLEAKVDRIGPQWIRTTDLMRIDADGFLWFVGRADDVISRGGFKIAPEQVAEALRKHPAVADAAVIGMPDPRLGQVPVAFIELRPGSAAPTSSELEAHARAHLAALQVPVRFVILEALPRTLSMKINTARLREMLAADASAEARASR